MKTPSIQYWFFCDRPVVVVWFLVSVVSIVSGCQAGPNYALVPALGTPTYSNVQSQILGPRCSTSECHSLERGAGNVVTTSYEDLMASPGAVVPYEPFRSQIYMQCLSKEMPRKSTPLSTQELELIYDWIAYGALNN